MSQVGVSVSMADAGCVSVLVRGCVLLSVSYYSGGPANLLRSRLRSQPAGLLAVGAIYVLIGILVATIAGRSRRDGRG